MEKKNENGKVQLKAPVEALYSVAGNHGIALDRNGSVGV